MELHSQEMLDFLREKIRKEHFVPGDRLPSIVSLARKFKLTQGQVRYGFYHLKREGLVVSRQGKGFFVARKVVSNGKPRQLLVALDLIQQRKFDFYDSIIGEAIRSELSGVHILQTVIPLLPGSRDIQMRQPDAVLLFRSKNQSEVYRQWSEYSEKHRIPVLFFNRFPPQKNLSFLSVNNVFETSRVIGRMLKNGARKIIYFQSGGHDFSDRREGFLRAYADCKLEFPEELMFLDDSMMEQKRFIDLIRDGGAEVLFCPCYMDLIQAVGIAVSAGIALQKKLSIFCFDDVGSFSDRMDFPVSYIRMPLARMVRIAVHYILRGATEPDLPPIRETFECSVCVNHCKYLI